MSKGLGKIQLKILEYLEHGSIYDFTYWVDMYEFKREIKPKISQQSINRGLNRLVSEKLVLKKWGKTDPGYGLPNRIGIYMMSSKVKLEIQNELDIEMDDKAEISNAESYGLTLIEYGIAKMLGTLPEKTVK